MIFGNPKDIISPKRWENKNLHFKLKYLWANYPGVAISLILLGVVGPIGLTLRSIINENSRYPFLIKYKNFYYVVRDDNPNLEKIIAERDAGSQYFPN